jgi:hypothetical protein
MTVFRPFFNAATGERTVFTAVNEDIDGHLVRFSWRSVPGGVITEHVHPRQLACESRLITPRGASARGTGPALTRRRQRILVRRCCRAYACRHRHAANSGPEADVGERPAPVAFGSSALTSHLDPDGEFGG